MVELLPGEGPQAAAKRRRKEHEDTLGKRGALWLRICRAPLEILSVSDVVECPLEALALELFTFVCEFVEFGFCR